ncbi:MAG TPA: hypothetical protein VI248_28595 [Kineosporiaceae bacterium]
MDGDAAADDGLAELAQVLGGTGSWGDVAAVDRQGGGSQVAPSTMMTLPAGAVSTARATAKMSPWARTVKAGAQILAAADRRATALVSAWAESSQSATAVVSTWMNSLPSNS